ncbi:MAG: extracellular solute-binding protein [Candidatus Atelocyanobacterium thalassa]
MPTRRSFLKIIELLAIGQLVSGCNKSDADLTISLLKGSVPPQSLKLFNQYFASNTSFDFQSRGQLIELFSLLEYWQSKQKKHINNSWPKVSILGSQKPYISDLLTLGDSWLTQAIQKDLIQPIAIDNWHNWHKLPSYWQNLVIRDQSGNLNRDGFIWGAPYRWGTTLIAYRVDKLNWDIKDWDDLWNPKLQNRISLIDQPREVIGFTLKKLGKSYNTKNIRGIPQLRSELRALDKQIKYYNSQYYLQPLLMGEAWASVGWSNDIIPILARNRNIKAIVPASGTSLWSDVWVVPKKNNISELSDTAQKWIDFCWQPEMADLISLFTNASSPMINNLDTEQLSPEIVSNPLLYLQAKTFDKCDFIKPLSKQDQKDYIELWSKIKSVK